MESVRLEPITRILTFIGKYIYEIEFDKYQTFHFNLLIYILTLPAFDYILSNILFL